MPDGGRDFMLATTVSVVEPSGSATGIALAEKGFFELSAGLAGQDDGVK
jgi:hypothetical protein